MAGGEKRRLKLAATLLMTSPGAPVVYYGTEVGLTQRYDAVVENAEARLPMLWGDERDATHAARRWRRARLRARAGRGADGRHPEPADARRVGRRRFRSRPPSRG